MSPKNKTQAQRTRSGRALLADINKEIQREKAVAARRLPSGDIVLAFETPEGRIQQEKEEEYLKAFGQNARTKRRLFTVMAHGVAVQNVNTHRQEEAIASLYKQNPNWKREGIEVHKLVWPHKTRRLQKTVGSLIIGVVHPSQANRLCDAGIVVQHQLHEVEIYHGDCKVTQCFRCREFGHIAKHCRSTEICGRCGSALHATNDCTSLASCTNCVRAKLKNTKHPTWARECPIRAERVQRAREAYAHRPTRYYFPESRSPSPTTSTSTSTGTSSTQTSQPSQPSQVSQPSQASQPSRPSQSSQSEQSRKRYATEEIDEDGCRPVRRGCPKINALFVDANPGRKI